MPAPAVVSTGSTALDALLSPSGDGVGGGIPLGGGGVWEVVGEAGVGKTQLALQLALSAVTCTPGGGDPPSPYVVYVSTEGPFPSERLASMAAATAATTGAAAGGGRVGTATLPLPAAASRVVVETLRTADALSAFVGTRLPWLLRHLRARLVVIDSIGAPYRQSEAAAARARARSLFMFATRLRAAIAALGLAWASCVNGRLFLRRRPGGRRSAAVEDEALVKCTVADEAMPFTVAASLSYMDIAQVLLRALVERPHVSTMNVALELDQTSSMQLLAVLERLLHRGEALRLPALLRSPTVAMAV
ncbi:hypothetical protein MMPV_000419 [Pyropia vietnamensis]